MVSNKTHLRALSHHQSEEMNILNISFPKVGIEPTICRVYSRTLVPLVLPQASTLLNK